MTTEQPDDSRPHVVMAVATGIAQDARVRKTALSVAAAGYRVTLVWGDTGGSARTAGTLGPVTTLGLPVHYTRRDRRVHARGARRRWRLPVVSYTSAQARRSAQQGLKRDGAAAGNRTLFGRLSHGARRQTHLWRSRALTVQDYVLVRAWHRVDRFRIRNRALLSWRRELPNIADLEHAFAPVLRDLNPDILHIHDVHLLGAGASAKKALAREHREVPFIYDAHEYIAGMTKGDPIVEGSYLRMEQHYMRAVDHVITVSDPIAETLRDDYRLSATPTVVLNAPLAAQKVPSKRQLRTEVGVPRDMCLLVYSGVLGVLRNIDVLVRALPQLPDTHLAIVCVPHSRTAAAQAFAVLADELGVGERLHLVDPVAPDEIIDFLATADIGVHPLVTGIPNHEMALPNKVFDYLHAGLPVAASNVAQLAELLRTHGIGVTFDPADVDSVAKAITAMWSDIDTFRKSVRNPDLVQMYSWESQERHLAALYAALEAR
ncbi:MAG: hypothetical protein CVT64_09595 [Actinobacteria bacterium HGW-Actinobacteria-4]|nr:MAG: hypothetical protein CVT64_09595 [Actinobacteria bacterium HGW-Actinobacteria-4]